MATDWIVYGMMGPDGVLIAGMAVALSCFMWAVLLGDAAVRVGFMPLLVGYVCGALGLAVSSFLQSYREFSNRVSTGILDETLRWSTVPGWTLYLSLLSLIAALPLATFVGAPLSALMLRTCRFTVAGITVAVGALWLGLGTLLWLFPINEWHRTHRLASFEQIMTDLLPWISLTTIPFLLGIYTTSRGLRRLGAKS